ncbi:hypothetical protein [Methanonatronarchaeum sp. AMET-Sl]|uniref:hypothetical protein n=1 Tax=Methanonatronarchaeum sp. AMET-Sl TaxID=3037654 RepID=UPI00244E01D3|nr:hypothetical protein [Methanonatronarchaeum sp. AMET-Sl]WGI17594.1 hypothetical protein QEN48_00880 [Methanonatronarchaeum sp. AMET-Sl]
MAGASGSELIIFIAAILIAASVAGVITTEVYFATDSFRESATNLDEQIRGDITIINDPTMIPNNDNTLEIYVKNTGASNLPDNPEYINILIDGAHYTNVDVDIIGSDVWRPGNTAQLDVNIDSDEFSSGDDVRILVYVESLQDEITGRLT